MKKLLIILALLMLPCLAEADRIWSPEPTVMDPGEISGPDYVTPGQSVTYTISPEDRDTWIEEDDFCERETEADTSFEKVEWKATGDILEGTAWPGVSATDSSSPFEFTFTVPAEAVAGREIQLKVTVYDDDDPPGGQDSPKDVDKTVTIFGVEVTHDPHQIAAETNWNQIEDNEQQSVITIVTDPTGHESSIVIDIKEVTPQEPQTADGTIVQNSDTQWTYTSFIESKNEKHPAVFKTVNIVGKFEEFECDTDHFFVFSVFTYLGSDLSPYQDRERAWQYARWKYDIDITGLNSVSYDPNLSTAGSTHTVTNDCRLGRGAFNSENVCASTLGHENVHGIQTWDYIMRSAASWFFGGPDFSEVDAYNWEINHAGQTGLSQDELNEAIAWRDYYNRQGPAPQ